MGRFYTDLENKVLQGNLSDNARNCLKYCGSCPMNKLCELQKLVDTLIEPVK